MSPSQLGGLISAIALALLLVAVLIVPRQPLVEPTNGVTAGGRQDNPTGLKGMSDLQARTQLQQWPERKAAGSGAGATSADRPSLAIGDPAPGTDVTRQWLDDRRDKQDILRTQEFLGGRATLPGSEANVLVQPQGRTWRRFHNEQLAYGGAFYVLGLSFLIAIFLAWRGRIPLKEGESGETIRRFTAFERANHWLTAGSFLLLALSGLVILYGDKLLRSWLGAGTYAELAQVSAWSHMAFAVPFVLGLLVMIAVWTRQNIPDRLDWEWLKRGGGFLRDEQPNPPAAKFNAGQKIVFWGVALGGLFLTATGISLMFPFYWSGYTGIQLAQILHAAAGLLMIGLIIGHIYIGTIGMVGAFEAMWSGRVDRNWAREHHSLWYRKITQDSPDHAAAASAQRRGVRSPWGSLASGVVVAALLAAAAAALYGPLSVSSSERPANPAVHLSSK